MRKIFLIALFALCAIEGFSQRYTPFQGWGFSARRLKADSVSIVPSDTVINKAPNSVAIFNGRVYFQNGTRWQDISYDLPINVRDSISALYPLLYNSSTGVLSADTGRNAASIATGGVVNKVKDSLAASIVLRLLISDTASMLSPYLRKVDTASISNRIDLKLNISDTASMLLSYRNTLNTVQVNKLNISDTASMLNNYRNTLNTVQVNKLNLSDSSLYSSRGRLYKVADSLGSVIASVSADSLVFSTKAYRQKGVDSVQANLAAGLALKLNISDTSSMLSPYYRTALANATIVQRITDSLRSLVRLRASGSGGIQLQNSAGTNVADFGIANTTNGSIAGGWNVGGNLSVTGTSGFTGVVSINGGNSNYILLNNIGILRANSTTNTLDLQAGTGGIRFMNANYTSSLFEMTNAGAGTFFTSLGATKGLFGGATDLTGISGGISVSGASSAGVQFRISDAGKGWIYATSGNKIAIDAASGVGFQVYTNASYSTPAIDVGTDQRTTLGGALTANGKATFTDSIVGVNQRLTGGLVVAPTTTNRVLIGTSLDNGNDRLQVSGSGIFSGGIAVGTNISLGNGFNLTWGGNYGANIPTIIGANGSNSFLTFYPSGSTNGEAARFSNAGNLLIGLTSDNLVDKLQVNGSILANGKITATAQGNNIAVTVDSTTITTSGYTLVLGDAGKFFRVKNGSTALTVTIPANSSVAFPVGTLIGIQQQGTAQITIAGASGVQIESESSLTKTAGQNAGIYLMKTSGDIWLLVGNRG